MRIRVAHKYFGNKKRSQVSERDLAEKLGGRVQPASGAINRMDLKADVKSADFLCDDKVCGGKSFSVSLKLWKKLMVEAWKNGKRPLMRLNFTEGEPLYLMDEVTMLELLDGFKGFKNGRH
jgi:hypothetical protein